MENIFKAIPISRHVYWVGAVDWSLRNFHGYATGRGTTYNAYLVLAERVTLIDTVKTPFLEEMFSRIRSVIDPARIEYIVSNHAEMDHSGGLPETVRRVNPSKLFASSRGVKALEAHFGDRLAPLAVSADKPLSLGGMNLRFVETPLLHWPDSMFSFLDQDGVLFSQDAFGMHLATSKLFADENPEWVLDFEEAKYFANILLPYSSRILSLLDQLAALDLPLQVLAPDHGPVWRRDFTKLFDFYRRWALQTPGRKAVILYDTMWGSTEKMARAFSEGIVESGCEARPCSMSVNHRSDAALEILEAGALVAGSPTINDHLFPTLADCLTYLRGLKPRNLLGAVFGSYGWNGRAVVQLREFLESMKVELPFEDIKALYVPGASVLEHLRENGRKLGKRLLAQKES